MKDLFPLIAEEAGAPLAMLAEHGSHGATGDRVRVAAAACLGLVALFFLWKARKGLWPPVLIGLVAAASLMVLFFTSPQVNGFVAEGFFGFLAGGCGVGSLSWLFVRGILPKAQAKYQAPGILVLSGLLSLAMLILALSWWLTAVDWYAISKNPVVTTGAQLNEQWALPWGARSRGIFAVGTIAAPGNHGPPKGEGSDVVAYFDAPGQMGSRGHSLLPLHYALRMADGEIVGVQGIQSVRETSKWPLGVPRSGKAGLRHGDPVVIWAEPGETADSGTGVSSGALTSTRVIAYGSMEDFLQGYVLSATATARMLGWIGFGLIPFAFVPLIFGLWRWRWLRCHGSDATRMPGGKSVRLQGGDRQKA